jgi:lipocalin
MLAKSLSVFFLSTLIGAVRSDGIPIGECDFDLAAYTGGWYEIATSSNVANTIENGCDCPVAYYTLNSTFSGNIDVTNSCIKDGSFWTMQGWGKPATNPRASKGNLNVFFSNSQTGSRVMDAYNGNYAVVKTWRDEYNDYTYALVGGSKNTSWWFLSRSPWNNGTVFDDAMTVLDYYGYNTTDYRMAVQDCVFTGGHDGVTLS